MHKFKLTPMHMEVLEEINSQFTHSMKFFDNLGPWTAAQVDLVHFEDDIGTWVKWVRSGEVEIPTFNYRDEEN